MHSSADDRRRIEQAESISNLIALDLLPVD